MLLVKSTFRRKIDILTENRHFHGKPLLHHLFTTSPPHLHHFFTTSPPPLHHFSTTSPPPRHHFSTTSPPLLHHFSTTSSPLLHHVHDGKFNYLDRKFPLDDDTFFPLVSSPQFHRQQEQRSNLNLLNARGGGRGATRPKRQWCGRGVWHRLFYQFN